MVKASKRFRQIVAALSYATVSICMTLANKAIAVGFDGPWGLILIQNFIATVILMSAVYFKVTDVPYSQEKVKILLPLNVLFVLMLFTSMSALKYLAVPMITIFKNCTNILIVAGDYYLYGNPVTTAVVGALGLMLTGAVLAGYYDLSFNFLGYFWMIMNCCVTAGYTLYVKRAKKESQLSPTGMSLYNNALSVPVILTWLVIDKYVLRNPRAQSLGGISEALMAASFSNQFMLILSGGIGCLLGVCVFWCITENSPTTTAFVGALNKIPLTLLGSILFSAKIGTMGYVFIAMNLAGGFWYVYEKNQMSKQGQSSKAAGRTGKQLDNRV